MFIEQATVTPIAKVIITANNGAVIECDDWTETVGLADSRIVEVLEASETDVFYVLQHGIIHVEATCGGTLVEEVGLSDSRIGDDESL